MESTVENSTENDQQSTTESDCQRTYMYILFSEHFQLCIGIVAISRDFRNENVDVLQGHL